MKLTVVVAFRDSSPEQDRARLWNWLLPKYGQHFPGCTVVIGTDNGEDPFHKTVALNRAVADADDGFIMLNDTDTWCPSSLVKAGLTMLAEHPDSWVRPWNLKLKLGPDDTEWVLKHGPEWDGEVPVNADHPLRRENLNTYWAAPPWLFTKEQFDRVGGFDERFRGWGQEDEAFCLAMRAIVGRPKTVLGQAVHLHHPRIGRSGKDWWPGEEKLDTHHRRPNEKLVVQYKSLVRRPKDMEQFVRSR